ncbi:Uncharacterised protein [Kluyvera cryocrescens]|uniref:Uncharacterized protein n=1 Tax=Kluyvera cryocrescens TaxID=580 RepID=A0A485BQV8_KLUCR|nr:Uncharacterised protein [Kluyvera cryocrescens]
MDRRQFISRFAATALVVKSGSIFAAPPLNLSRRCAVAGNASGGGGPVGEMITTPKGAQTHIAVPY